MPPLTVAAPAALFESFLPGPEGRSFRFEGLERVLVASRRRRCCRCSPRSRRPWLPVTMRPDLSATRRLPASTRPCRRIPGGRCRWPGSESLPSESRSNPDRPRSPVPAGWLIVPACLGRGGLRGSIRAVKEYIAAGDSYQVNLTFRQRFRFTGEPFALYRQLCAAQPAAFCAWLDLGDVAIASASPELFFARRGDEIVMRPMKGTAPRGIDAADDRRRREQLAASPKERAENLMIVDLVRNDLGRVAVTGCVAVPGAVRGGKLPDTAPDDLNGDRPVAGGHRPGRHLPRAVPLRVGDRGAEAAQHGDHQRAGGGAARSLLRGPRFRLAGGEAMFSVAIRTAVLDLRRGTRRTRHRQRGDRGCRGRHRIPGMPRQGDVSRPWCRAAATGRDPAVGGRAGLRASGPAPAAVGGLGGRAWLCLRWTEACGGNCGWWSRVGQAVTRFACC